MRSDILTTIQNAIKSALPAVRVLRMHAAPIGAHELPIIIVRYDTETVQAKNSEHERELSVAVDLYAVGEDAEGDLEDMESALSVVLIPNLLGNGKNLAIKEVRWDSEDSTDGVAVRETIIYSIKYRTKLTGQILG